MRSHLSRRPSRPVRPSFILWVVRIIVFVANCRGTIVYASFFVLEIESLYGFNNDFPRASGHRGEGLKKKYTYMDPDAARDVVGKGTWEGVPAGYLIFRIMDFDMGLATPPPPLFLLMSFFSVVTQVFIIFRITVKRFILLLYNIIVTIGISIVFIMIWLTLPL